MIGWYWFTSGICIITPFYRREDRGCEQSHEATVACPRLQPANSRAELRTPSHLMTVSAFPFCFKNSINTPPWRQDPNVWQIEKGASHIWLEYKLTLCNSLKPGQTTSDLVQQLNSGHTVTHMCLLAFFLAGENVPGRLGTSHLIPKVLLWRQGGSQCVCGNRVEPRTITY